ncbi:hypothetical protein PZO64_16755 [Pantoea vagans]|nr:hypothetical protein [Pantoea vagans]MDE8557942.1 hypothetical protein [Pantoea vagans]
MRYAGEFITGIVPWRIVLISKHTQRVDGNDIESLKTTFDAARSWPEP